MNNYTVVYNKLKDEQNKSIELRKLAFDGRMTKEQRFKLRKEQEKHWKKRIFLLNLLKSMEK